jgi:uncharacterized protein (TIGR03435 family)
MSIFRPFSRMSSVAFGAVLIAALHLPAQQATQAVAATPVPVYDVVSIHENKSGSGGMSFRWTEGGFAGSNITVPLLLTDAYDLRQELISGLPGWADSFHFDLNAKVSDPDVNALKKLSPDQRRAMMLALLNDRFHLRAHIEIKTLPVYDLVLAKGGSKLKEDNALPSKDFDPADKSGKPPTGGFLFSAGQMTGTAIPVSTLAATLAVHVERNIIDKTGLNGKYDINLKWTPPELESKDTGVDNNAPDLFTALQEQLGLKLESSKGPVDTLVIDHVEMPTAN